MYSPDSTCWTVIEEAVARARRGEGPTLIEAMVGRLRGHSEGDDSLAQVPAEDLERYRAEDPVACFERELLANGILDSETSDAMGRVCSDLIIEMVDRAQQSADPDPSRERTIHAR